MDVQRLGHIEKVKQKFTAIFKIIDMELISFYLDLKVEKNCKKKMLKLS